LIGGQRSFTKWASLRPSIDPGIWMSVNIKWMCDRPPIGVGGERMGDCSLEIERRNAKSVDDVCSFEIRRTRQLRVEADWPVCQHERYIACNGFPLKNMI
jgi:hypothetical protein